jgi:hypothetical protein
MASRITFSGLHSRLLEIAEHHEDLEASLRLYFSDDSPDFTIRFAGYANAEVMEELSYRLSELGLTSSMAVSASLEATFRIDYLKRCYRRRKDPISRAFREIYKKKHEWASLEDIFAIWLDTEVAGRRIVGELRGAFHFRHWLAHGRYWTPKFQ